MAEYIGRPPAVKTIPVTRGTDVSFTLRRKDTEGNLVDWDVDIYVEVDQGPKSTPQKFDAVITGPDAYVRIESEVSDTFGRNTEWRAIRSTPGNPSLERPLVVGGFERFDGKKT